MAKKPKMPRTGRRAAKRSKKKRILLVCGGRVTEREYFEFVKAELNATAVKVVSPKEGKDPVGLVKYAAKMKRQASHISDDAYDEVWAITDTDQFHSLSDAQKLADKEGVRLSITNPCFEVWLIDHMCECPLSCAVTSACEKKAVELGLVTRGKGNVKNVKKAKHIVSERLAGKVHTALSNAERHNSCEKESVRNNSPDKINAYAVWTDVPGIIASISNGTK